MQKLDFITTDFEDLACHTGATWIADIFFQQECSNLPNDLTGYSARLVVYSSTATIATIAGTISDPTSGSVRFLIPAATTANYAEGIYDHHIELLIDSTVLRIGYGKFEVSA